MIRFPFLVTAASMAVILLGAEVPAAAGQTLDHVRAAGSLSCGVISVTEDYERTDVHGSLDDLGTEICRAVSAAVLKDPARISASILPDETHAFDALAAGKVDLLVGVSPSQAIGVARAIRFGHPVFYDGDAFMVNRKSGIRSAADLAGKQVCFIGGTTPEETLDSEMARRGIKVLPFPWSEDGEMNVGLLTGHCDAIVRSASRLANTRSGFHARIGEFEILPDRLSVEPVVPAMRDGDAEWAAIVDSTIEALLTAERAGIGKADAGVLRTTEDPVMHRLGGLMPGIDEKRVDRDWAVRAVAAVGNYGEVYDRTVGPSSSLGLPRGLNALWDRGGLMVDGPSR